MPSWIGIVVLKLRSIKICSNSKIRANIRKFYFSFNLSCNLLKNYLGEVFSVSSTLNSFAVKMKYPASCHGLGFPANLLAAGISTIAA